MSSCEIIDDERSVHDAAQPSRVRLSFALAAFLAVPDAPHVAASRIQLVWLDADERDNRRPRKRNEMFLMNENAAYALRAMNSAAFAARTWRVETRESF